MVLDFNAYEKYLIAQGTHVPYGDVPSLLLAKIPQAKDVQYNKVGYIEVVLEEPVRGWRTFVFGGPSSALVRVEDVEGLAAQAINEIENDSRHSVFAEAK